MTASEQSGYLFRDDPKSCVADWARSLRYFRFVRSGGGMSGGGDSLRLAVRVRTQAELEEIFAMLGVRLRPVLPDPAEQGGCGNVRFEAGPLDDPEAVRRMAPAVGAIRIGEATVHAYIAPGALELNIADEIEPWRVTHAAVHAAREIEPAIDRFAGRLIDPPQDDELCISPKHHPGIWETPAERAVRIQRLRRNRALRRALGWGLLAAGVLYLSHGLLG